MLLFSSSLRGFKVPLLRHQWFLSDPSGARLYVQYCRDILSCFLQLVLMVSIIVMIGDAGVLCLSLVINVFNCFPYIDIGLKIFFHAVSHCCPAAWWGLIFNSFSLSCTLLCIRCSKCCQAYIHIRFAGILSTAALYNTHFFIPFLFLLFLKTCTSASLCSFFR